MIQSYEDFEVYKRSYAMALKMYQISKSLPEDEKFGMISQIRRASLSIPLNIAEGYGKKSSASEFKRYLTMSLGSCNEMAVLIEFCKDLCYIEISAYKPLKTAYEEIGKMLHVLIGKWR